MTKPNTNPPRPAAHPARASQAFSPDAAGAVPSATHDESAIKPGEERFAIANEIERCVKAGHHKAYGTSSSQSTLTAGNEWWLTVAKLLRETPRSETAPLVAGDLKTQREIHDSYAPVSATRPSAEPSFYASIYPSAARAAPTVSLEDEANIAFLRQKDSKSLRRIADRYETFARAAKAGSICVEDQFLMEALIEARKNRQK